MTEQQLFDAPVTPKKESKPKPSCPRCGKGFKTFQPKRLGQPVLTKTGKVKFPAVEKAQRKGKQEGIKPGLATYEAIGGPRDVKVCGKCVYELGRLR